MRVKHIIPYSSAGVGRSVASGRREQLAFANLSQTCFEVDGCSLAQTFKCWWFTMITQIPELQGVKMRFCRICIMNMQSKT